MLLAVVYNEVKPEDLTTKQYSQINCFAALGKGVQPIRESPTLKTSIFFQLPSQSGIFANHDDK